MSQPDIAANQVPLRIPTRKQSDIDGGVNAEPSVVPASSNQSNQQSRMSVINQNAAMNDLIAK
jgi:hypothetical protein